ncbi:hypothetical protein M427DRAFT_150086 [Gonapodya prolifera JEL478]|uniref:Uncharacterized protein n=1 Tax=Gonapodya prolifera (strain JEL478) TaxID=1344416 RepID=A0A138ZXM7_GONPJ|nr:hypothetical protein M427DRAFT_150086 [Gonapodya prolifera JEL478]|eukprot:KXS09201.1 hypothetical protein M427DRAFT_150086 [Gonapodya prolifera JEL478]
MSSDAHLTHAIAMLTDTYATLRMREDAAARIEATCAASPPEVATPTGDCMISAICDAIGQNLDEYRVSVPLLAALAHLVRSPATQTHDEAAGHVPVPVAVPSPPPRTSTSTPLATSSPRRFVILPPPGTTSTTTTTSSCSSSTSAHRCVTAARILASHPTDVVGLVADVIYEGCVAVSTALTLAGGGYGDTEPRRDVDVDVPAWLARWRYCFDFLAGMTTVLEVDGHGAMHGAACVATYEFEGGSLPSLLAWSMTLLADIISLLTLDTTSHSHSHSPLVGTRDDPERTLPLSMAGEASPIGAFEKAAGVYVVGSPAKTRLLPSLLLSASLLRCDHSYFCVTGCSSDDTSAAPKSLPPLDSTFHVAFERLKTDPALAPRDVQRHAQKRCRAWNDVPGSAAAWRTAVNKIAQEVSLPTVPQVPQLPVPPVPRPTAHLSHLPPRPSSPHTGRLPSLSLSLTSLSGIPDEGGGGRLAKRGSALLYKEDDIEGEAMTLMAEQWTRFLAAVEHVGTSNTPHYTGRRSADYSGAIDATRALVRRLLADPTASRSVCGALRHRLKSLLASRGPLDVAETALAVREVTCTLDALLHCPGDTYDGAMLAVATLMIGPRLVDVLQNQESESVTAQSTVTALQTVVMVSEEWLAVWLGRERDPQSGDAKGGPWRARPTAWSHVPRLVELMLQLCRRMGPRKNESQTNSNELEEFGSVLGLVRAVFDVIEEAVVSMQDQVPRRPNSDEAKPRSYGDIPWSQRRTESDPLVAAGTKGPTESRVAEWVNKSLLSYISSLESLRKVSANESCSHSAHILDLVKVHCHRLKTKATGEQQQPQRLTSSMSVIPRIRSPRARIMTGSKEALSPENPPANPPIPQLGRGEPFKPLPRISPATQLKGRPVGVVGL